MSCTSIQTTFEDHFVPQNLQRGPPARIHLIQLCHHLHNPQHHHSSHDPHHLHDPPHLLLILLAILMILFMLLMILMLTIIILQTHWCIVEDSWLPRGPILLEKKLLTILTKNKHFRMIKKGKHKHGVFLYLVDR